MKKKLLFLIVSISIITTFLEIIPNKVVMADEYYPPLAKAQDAPTKPPAQHKSKAKKVKKKTKKKKNVKKSNKKKAKKATKLKNKRKVKINKITNYR